jgi:hypothetical protein
MDKLYRFVECVDDDCEKDELHEFVLVERCEHGKIDGHNPMDKQDDVGRYIWCEGADCG